MWNLFTVCNAAKPSFHPHCAQGRPRWGSCLLSRVSSSTQSTRPGPQRSPHAWGQSRAARLQVTKSLSLSQLKAMNTVLQGWAPPAHRPQSRGEEAFSLQPGSPGHHWSRQVTVPKAKSPLSWQKPPPPPALSPPFPLGQAGPHSPAPLFPLSPYQLPVGSETSHSNVHRGHASAEVSVCFFPQFSLSACLPQVAGSALPGLRGGV